MKKRLPLLLTALCFLLCAAPLAGCTPAEEDVYGPTEKPGYPCENDEYTYLIHPESGEATITSYLGTAEEVVVPAELDGYCLLYTSPSPRDPKTSRMPSSA